jgi:tRNA 2-thiocytidine biosynthesis protein TtcA
MRNAANSKVVKSVTNTIKTRNLADQGDTILVGISGGKDSLALLDCLFLSGFRNLHSIHIRIDKTSPLTFERFCRERSDFTVIDTCILLQVQNSKRRNVCYMCSREKRKTISSFAVEHGFTRLALAHHRDDVIETLLLNLIFQREISTMMPKQILFEGRLEIIRPLYDTAEKDVRRYAKTENLPVSEWRCGFETDSRRAWVKQQIRNWQKENPGTKISENIFRALHNINPDYLPHPVSRKKA